MQLSGIAGEGRREPVTGLRRAQVLLFLRFQFALVVIIAGCGSSGSPSDPPILTGPPSNLIYPTSVISGTVGQPMEPHVPTVSGTVASYSISPALPPGLSIDVANGTISGTPTVSSAKASYTATARNAVGSTTAIIQIEVNPPSLTYPQTEIVATVGQGFTSDAPIVSGRVIYYSISPALPAGLNIDSSYGWIYGTPTIPSARAPYTVTAHNVGGSITTALIQITVNPPLTYPQTEIVATVGQAITPDVPSITGIAISFSVTPTLPSGLSLDASTGVIFGVPTVAAVQTVYTVAATYSTGTTTASIAITVGEAQNTLLELGHANSIRSIRILGDRVLSVDTSGHWNLWTYPSRVVIAAGDASPDYDSTRAVKRIDMAGQTFVLGIVNGLEIRSVSDGHLLSLLVYPGINCVAYCSSYQGSSWWQLASDGASVTIGSKSGLSIFSPTGQVLATRAGDYSSAKASSVNGTVLVALGAAGRNVIESISTANGASKVSPPFSGEFNSWFVDEARFLTNQGNTVWVYSPDAVQQAIVSLPTVANLTGQGDWIWTHVTDQSGYPLYPLEVYPVGSQTPALSYKGDSSTIAIASGKTIGILASGPGQVSVIDLSGANPTRTDYSTPLGHLGAYAINSSSQWVVGNGSGAMLDGASLAGTPKYFGHGTALSIAGSSNRVAVSTASGEILVFNPSVASLEQTINFRSAHLELSSDGTVLGVSAADQIGPDRTLNFYSLPSGIVTKSFPYKAGGINLLNFTLAASGTMISQVTSQSSGYYTATVSPLSGTPVTWTETGTLGDVLIATTPIPEVELSPDGTLIAAPHYPKGNYTTQILKDGTLVTALPGSAVGWIDDNRLLVDQYAYGTGRSGSLYAYSGSAIYSATGAQLAAPPLPQLNSFQTVTTDSVYDPSHNAIYSLTTGQPTWKATLGSIGVGAVAGPYVVYEGSDPIYPGQSFAYARHSVVLETY